MCMCRISPFFRRNRSAFPSFSLYWFDFWALPLYWFWFQRLPNKLPKLVRRLMAFCVPRTCWRALFPYSTWENALRARPVTTNLIDDVSNMGGVFASWFFKVVQKSPKSETRAFLSSSRVWQFLNVFDMVLFWRDILEKMKLILAFCSICERENFLKHRFPCAFPSLAIWGLTFNWSKLRISVDFWVSVFDIFFRLCELISP